MGYGRDLKKFPVSIQKILPAALTLGMLMVLGGCQASTTSVEASTSRDPVVAPAGTVLRVRLNQALETGRSRPGDRFSGVLDSPVVVGAMEVLPKGTEVEGHVLASRTRRQEAGRVTLALTLDCFSSNGRKIAIETSVVSRASAPEGAGYGQQRVSVAAQSILGFTLTSPLTA